jgi:CHASE3 domain sensor protein
MKLLPISRDITEDIHWNCHECSNNIPLQQRDAVFEEIRAAIQDKYFLHTFDYDRQNNRWSIESAEWISPNGTRLDSKRKRISSDFRTDLIEEFITALNHTLEIEIDTIKDYFLDG